MAYFLDRVWDVPKRAGKRNRNDFDEASAVPVLQDVIALQPRKRRRRKGDNPRQIFEVTDKHGGREYPSSFNSTRALKQYQNGTDAGCQCEKCGKTFNSKRALDQHQNATGHAGRETPAKMALSFPIRKTLPIETNWANIALTAGQRRYDKAMRDDSKSQVVCVGPAGTGKTMLAVREGLRRLLLGIVHKMIFVRPAKSAGENLGHLPGNLNSKIQPYMRSMQQYVDQILGTGSAKQLEDAGKIEGISLEVEMQGLTLTNVMVVADEMQNASAEQLKLLQNRQGSFTKLVIIGDPKQKKTRSGMNPLQDLVERIDRKKPPSICVVCMQGADIMRDPVLQEVAHLWSDSDSD